MIAGLHGGMVTTGVVKGLVTPVGTFVWFFWHGSALSGENGAAWIQGWDFDKRVQWG